VSAMMQLDSTSTEEGLLPILKAVNITAMTGLHPR
jgi:hypothetical protein